MDFAKVIVDRAGGFWKDRARTYQIEVDGQAMGAIREWESRTVSVPAGSIRIQMTLDFVAKSRQMPIKVEPGETVRFVCAAGKLKDFPPTSGWIKLWPGSMDTSPPPFNEEDRESIDWDTS